MQVKNLHLYPRINSSICESLNDLPKLNVVEHKIEFSKTAIEIHGLLYKLLEECVCELKRELFK